MTHGACFVGHVSAVAAGLYFPQENVTCHNESPPGKETSPNLAESFGTVLTGAPSLINLFMLFFLSTLRSRGHLWRLSLAAWVCISLFPIHVAKAQPLIIAYPDYWPFFTREDADGRMKGFFYEIVTEGLGRLGIKAEWQVFPWTRCQANVEKGEADAFITVPTEERLRYTVTHETPFYLKKLNIFTYSGNPRMREIKAIRDIEDIREAGLSVVTYLGNGWNEENIESRGIRTVTVSGLPNVWLMLANKRGDIAIEWPFSAWPQIVRHGVASRIVQTGVALEAMPFHLMIRKDSPYAARLSEFDAVVRAMLRDGEIDDIVRKYTN